MTSNNEVILNGSVNGIGKLKENDENTLIKLQAISRLKKCDYLTPPRVIADYLIDLFGVWVDNPTHWLYIAEYYTPKSICSVINQMSKTHQRGSVKLKSPPSYFTSVIRSYHKPRMRYRKGAHKKHKEKIKK